jgi:hypothetical protein
MAETTIAGIQPTLLYYALTPHKPEANNTQLPNKGILQGFTAFIPLGGQMEPISIAGARLEWKKAQKKLKNNRDRGHLYRLPPR